MPRHFFSRKKSLPVISYCCQITILRYILHTFFKNIFLRESHSSLVFFECQWWFFKNIFLRKSHSPLIFFECQWCGPTNFAPPKDDRKGAWPLAPCRHMTFPYYLLLLNPIPRRSLNLFSWS